ARGGQKSHLGREVAVGSGELAWLAPGVAAADPVAGDVDEAAGELGLPVRGLPDPADARRVMEAADPDVAVAVPLPVAGGPDGAVVRRRGAIFDARRGRRDGDADAGRGEANAAAEVGV